VNSPRDLGFSQFPKWRDGQWAAVQAAIDSDTRFTGLVLPTGSGKSLIAMSWAALLGGRTVYVTSTKGLQEQLVRDYEDSGIQDIRGRASYLCDALTPGGALSEFAEQGLDRPSPTGERLATRAPRGHDAGCDKGPCYAGVKCVLRADGCGYFDALRAAQTATFVVTNYAYWLRSGQYGEGLGPVDSLILDEAHAAPDELANALEFTITAADREAVQALPPPEGAGGNLGAWADWASGLIRRARQQAVGCPRTAQDAHRVLRVKSALLKLESLVRAALAGPDSWIIDSVETRSGRGTRFSPIIVAPYLETLAQGVKNVLFLSATLSDKTAALLGIPRKEWTKVEGPSTFPIERRPVIYIPTIRVDHRATEADLALWVGRIDQIIGQRLDRKGIVHTVSYARQQYLAKYSRHAQHFCCPSSQTTRADVARFKLARPPAILVSPSVVTGWDFPYSECRYQILAKTPFPDTRNPVMKARCAQDDQYQGYLAMMAIVQAVGRGMRAADDWCEVFLVDSHWEWVRRKYKHHVPAWFWSACRQSSTLPAPLNL